MKHITQLLLLLPLLWAAGCQKESSPNGDGQTGEGNEAEVQIHASLADPAPATKAIIKGTDIPDQFSYGIFVCKTGTTDKKDAHKENSWNLKAAYAKGAEGEEGTWSYQYVNDFGNGTLNADADEKITITAPVKGDPKADLYAYAPYIAAAHGNDPTAIPFEISSEIRNQVDLMYAEENNTGVNKGLDPTSAGDDPLEANFTFKHALALLAFEFEIKNYSDDFSTMYRLLSITIKKKNPGSNTTAKLYQSGYFNAITGQLNANRDIKLVDQLSISFQKDNGEGILLYPNKNETPDLTAYMALFPTQLEDDELEIEFKFNQTNPITVKPIVLKKQYLKHGTGDDYGFRSGYMYTFKFTMDNYLFLKDFVVAPWNESINLISEDPIQI